MIDKCSYPNCKYRSDMVYLDKPLCDKHWNMIDTAPALLRRKIGLPVECEAAKPIDRPIHEPMPEAPLEELPPGAKKAMGSLGLRLQQNRRL